MKKYLPHLFFSAALIVAFIIYRPGLNGPFLFDDYANLEKLGAFDGVRNYETFKRFVLGGIGGPTGRPVTLLSFLIDATTWPASPYSFKLTNLLLHLLTGVVLFGVTKQLLLIRSDHINQDQAVWVAGIAIGSWILHPFFVSTTLYVIQRMAVISSLFVGIGLLCYVHGRSMLNRCPAKAYFWMSFSVIACTLLATFSKENGALLPVLLLVVEWLVLKDKRSGLAVPHRLWTMLFLWLPLLLLGSYIFLGLVSGKFAGAYSFRQFTLLERVLTEGRIIFDYLYHLFIPQMYSRGLFTENFPVSGGLFSPPSTFFSVLGVFALLGAGVILRKRFPFFSLAVFFFFTGHIIESTVFPLELYFEHRNYLPSFFLFLPLSQVLVVYPTRRTLSIALVSLWMLVLTVFTAQRTSLWGNANQLALLWSQANPTSQRAQRTSALMLEKSGDFSLALGVLKQAAINMPNNMPIKLHLFLFQCIYQGTSQEELDSANLSFRSTPYDFRTFNLLRSIVETGLSGACKGVASDQLLSILTALSNNLGAQRNPRAQYQLDHLLGLVYAHQQKRLMAFEHFNRALINKKDIEVGLMQSAILATNQFYREALLHLETTEKISDQKKKHFRLSQLVKYNQDLQFEITQLKMQINNDTQQADDQPGNYPDSPANFR